VKISLHKKYRTRDGRPVELLTTSARGAWPVIGHIGDSESLVRWSLDGTFCGTRLTRALDLVEVKPKRVLWLNVYPCSNGIVYDSREGADEGAAAHRIACLKIEFEEGEGL